MVWLLLTLLFLPAPTEAQPKAADLIRSVKETYAGAKQYRFAAHIVERGPGIETTGSDEIAVDKRGRVWFKATGSLAVAFSGGREEETLITVADGKNVWVYLEQQKLYKRVAGMPESRNHDLSDDAMDNPREFARKLIDGLFVRYAQLSSRASQAKIVREERCSTNGLTTDCYVIEIPAASSGPDVRAVYTLWVDKDRNLVLRDDFSITNKSSVTYSNSTLYDVAELNPQLPENLFTFTAPQGTKEVVSFYQ
jgi:outer membrane lipoprotein-sorting protein